jgi:CBS domain-containing protein
MATISNILATKGSRVASTGPQATIYDAAAQMNRDKIGSLLVLDQDRVVGIITERDILVRVVAQRRDAGTTRVGEVMTSELVCGRLHTSVEEARLVMKERRIRHLPILDDNDEELLGLISIGDLNAHEAHSQEQTIYLLQEYITGRV